MGYYWRRLKSKLKFHLSNGDVITMALTAPQLEAAWAHWVRHRNIDLNSPMKFTKPELRTALAAATTWIEDNQASFVAGLAGTAFAGAGSTADEKRRLFLSAFAHKYDIEVG